MLELVLSPASGQLSVHTPFLIRKGEEIIMFYSRADELPDDSGEKDKKKPKEKIYKIYYGISKDGKNFKLNSEPIIEMNQSVCRPWIIKIENEYKMFFVKALPDKIARRYRICCAESKDLEKWKINSQPVIDKFGKYEHIASPCVVKHYDEYWMYLSAADKPTHNDKLFIGQSKDAKKFEINPNPFYQPTPNTGYSESCYTPCVYEKDGQWNMLFSGMGNPSIGQQATRYTTFLASSSNGIQFSMGTPVITLANDPRFVRGAYKAVIFEEYVYFVGGDSEGKTSIYRILNSELPV